MISDVELLFEVNFVNKIDIKVTFFLIISAFTYDTEVNFRQNSSF